MEGLTSRERAVVSEMTNLARQYGRWPTVREVGNALAAREGLQKLSVASTMRILCNKGVLVKEWRTYAVKGYRVVIKKAVLVSD